jgi:hypothetical protein
LQEYWPEALEEVQTPPGAARVTFESGTPFTVIVPLSWWTAVET